MEARYIDEIWNKFKITRRVYEKFNTSIYFVRITEVHIQHFRGYFEIYLEIIFKLILIH